MNNTQIKNTLDWIEAMLSGRYKHGTNLLYNTKTQCHCGIGVAAEVMGVERFETENAGLYLFNEEVTGNYLPTKRYTSVPETWFQRTFGLPRQQQVYSHINDMSKNYLQVVALLLEHVRQHAYNSPRWMELYDKFNKASAIRTQSGGL